MLFAGYRSIIATMWAMEDADGPNVAHTVYSTLVQEDEIDYDDILYALDIAIQRVRTEGVSPYQGATYIHTGA